MNITITSYPSRQRWAYYLAGACACAIFPLIWVGGLVTTYDAGMAVPDWPSTYGANLWLYSWSQWITGPWDLFIEHGHRLLGSLVGMLAMALLVVAWWPVAVASRETTTLRRLSVLLLLAVISQGVLGGMRVLWAERDLARLHGCCGPLVFALACWVWSYTAIPQYGANHVTSIRSTGGSNRSKWSPAAWLRLAGLTSAFAFSQIVLGAFLRHVPLTMSPNSFRILVFSHLAMALLVTWSILWLTWTMKKTFPSSDPGARRPLQKTMHRAAALVVVQLLLGTATWIAKYSWPSFLSWMPGSAAYVVQADGWLSSMIITAHVAIGSLILAHLVVSTAWCYRLGAELDRAARQGNPDLCRTNMITALPLPQRRRWEVCL